MGLIKTGIYKSHVIKYKTEIYLDEENIRKEIENLEEIIKKQKKSTYRRGTQPNIERLLRVQELGRMLLEGHSHEELTKHFGLKRSTIESYLLCFE